MNKLLFYDKILNVGFELVRKDFVFSHCRAEMIIHNIFLKGNANGKSKKDIV